MTKGRQWPEGWRVAYRRGYADAMGGRPNRADATPVEVRDMSVRDYLVWAFARLGPGCWNECHAINLYWDAAGRNYPFSAETTRVVCYRLAQTGELEKVKPGHFQIAEPGRNDT